MLSDYGVRETTDFFVSAQPGRDGRHVVHTSACSLLPSLGKRIAIGRHEECGDALAVARIFGGFMATACNLCCAPEVAQPRVPRIARYALNDAAE